MDQAHESTPPQRSRRPPAAGRGLISRRVRRVTLPLKHGRLPRFAGVAAFLAFALWQRQGKVSVIAADGTVLAASVEPRLATLPFVVGNGAAAKARGFLAALDQYPAIRDSVRASILVGERRWNLRLKNGIDVR